MIKKGRLPWRSRVIGWSAWTKPCLIRGLTKLTALPSVMAGVSAGTNAFNRLQLRQLPTLQFRWTAEVHGIFRNRIPLASLSLSLERKVGTVLTYRLSDYRSRDAKRKLRKSLHPSNQPTNQPTNLPTYQLTNQPTNQPINPTSTHIHQYNTDIFLQPNIDFYAPTKQ